MVFFLFSIPFFLSFFLFTMATAWLLSWLVGWLVGPNFYSNQMSSRYSSGLLKGLMLSHTHTHTLWPFACLFSHFGFLFFVKNFYLLIHLKRLKCGWFIHIWTLSRRDVYCVLVHVCTTDYPPKCWCRRSRWVRKEQTQNSRPSNEIVVDGDDDDDVEWPFVCEIGT